MQMLNRYFTPFALILISLAFYYRVPEEGETGLPMDIKLSIAIVAASVLVNWWLSANKYRFIRWATALRHGQVWINYLWSALLVYFLVPYWAPMWLLLVMAPVAAALSLGKGATWISGLVSAGTMLGIYAHRGMAPEGPAFGMALAHAAFIVIFSLFVHALAEAALRLRDAGPA